MEVFAHELGMTDLTTLFLVVLLRDSWSTFRIGHNLGCTHASSDIDERGAIITYGDPTSVMGNSFFKSGEKDSEKDREIERERERESVCVCV
jgi:hypothetical protein